MVFDPKKYIIKVQGGRQYLPVSARLIWFREVHPDWGIETRIVSLDTDKQYAVFEAFVYNGDGKLMAKGTKMEDIRGFPDYVEKAETGAIGRALAVCGFGTQFAPELDEMGAGRFVDSPQAVSDTSRYDKPRYGGRDSGDGRDNGDSYRSQQNGRRDAPAAQVSRPAPAPAPVTSPTPRRSDDADHAANEARTETVGDPLAQPRAASADAGATKETACSACGRELTHSQAVLSIGKFGVALCPTCQKERRAADA
ncbi:MAG TPA: hypothetical protein VGK19_25525 [Capsulimonadaceae bacterium]|jgi:hypothetical protein